MELSDYVITKAESGEELPFDLLLLADETIDAIEKYIYDSEVYKVWVPGHPQPVAVFALYPVSISEVEIKNIAVAESMQGRGLGSYLLTKIKAIAASASYKTIIVGTPDTSSLQIRFYEKNGFLRFDVRKDFFLKNYPEPIIEDGVLLRDMAMLRIEL